MKFAVANQFFMIADQAGVDYTNVLRAIREDYPRAADLPGPGLRRRPVPVQGHDAARGLHGRPLPPGPGGDAGQRGPAGLHRVRAGAPLRRPPGPDGRHPGHGVQGRVGRHPRVAQLQAAQAPRVGRRARAVHRPVRRRRPAGPARRACSTESDILVIGAPHRAYRGARPRRHATWSTSGARSATGIRAASARVLVTGAAGFICGYLVPELLEAGHEVVGVDNFSKYGRVAKSYDAHPRYRFVEGDAKDVALHDASSPPTATRSSPRPR